MVLRIADMLMKICGRRRRQAVFWVVGVGLIIQGRVVEML